MITLLKSAPSLISPATAKIGWALPWKQLLAGVLILALLSAALGMSFLYAPTESSMGEVQRILYLHVPVAWVALTGCLGMGACGMLYLSRRRLFWDFWAQAAGELGWLCCTLTLITGSLWAHSAWGVWWTWEPRLTSALVLWLVFAGVFLVRASIEDPHQRARIGAVLSLLGVADVPLVIMATRWFRGVHPVSPSMDPDMRLVLLISVAGFFAFFVYLAFIRRQQLELANRLPVVRYQDDSL